MKIRDGFKIFITGWKSVSNKIADASIFEKISGGISEIGIKSGKSTTSLAEFVGALSPGKLALGAAGIAVVSVALVALVKYMNRFKDAMKSTAEAHSEFTQAKQELDNLKSKLEETQAKIEELNSIENPTLVEQAELDKLQQANAELERQIELKNQETQKKAKISVDEATRTLGLKATQDLTTARDSTHAQSGQKIVTYNETDLVTATQHEIAKYKELQQQRKKLFADRKNPHADKKDIDSKIDSLDDEIRLYKDSITTQSSQLSDLRDVLLDNYDTLTAEQKQLFDSVTNVIDDGLNIDLSKAEASLKKLDSFFSKQGGSAIKTKLQEASASGEDLNNTLASMGLTLDDLGIENIDTLSDYLRTTADSASEAKKAVEDFNVSIADVEAAFGSENAGSDYDKMLGLLKQAQELYTNGLIGTDDFQKTYSEGNWLVLNFC